MTIKDLREILVHYEGKECDNWELVLFDFNNQRTIDWLEGVYASSNVEKRITFPVRVDPVDGECIDERIKRLIKELKEKK